jgi:hypothetical protein
MIGPWPRQTYGLSPGGPWLFGAWFLEAHERELERRQRQRDWVNELAARWGLVRAPESLTIAEIAEQLGRMERALGRRFYLMWDS